ncbi:MAG: DUF2065 domain-containing protein [Pseudomonadota bacterium]
MVLIVAIGLALAFEGAAYALFPDAMRRAAETMFALGERQIRIAGAAIFALGAVIALVATETS